MIGLVPASAGVLAGVLQSASTAAAGVLFLWVDSGDASWPTPLPAIVMSISKACARNAARQWSSCIEGQLPGVFHATLVCRPT